MLLETASALLRLQPYDDVRVVLAFAAGPRSEVQIIQTTATGERFVAKQYLGNDGRRRFIAETSVLRTLSEQDTAPVPRLRAVSADDLVIVMTEATGVAVENVIRLEKRDSARLAMVRYASAIGLLHRVSREAVDRITSARRDAGFREDEFLPPFARDPRDSARRVAELIGWSADTLTVELRDVIAESFASNSANALIQWDTWPGNAIAGPDAVTLIDFEDALRGNAVLDVCSWHLAFPAAPLRVPFSCAIASRSDRPDGRGIPARGGPGDNCRAPRSGDRGSHALRAHGVERAEAP